MNDEMLRQLGLFLGIFFKLTLPAVIVWYNTKDFKWDHKYTKQAVLSVFVAFGTLAFGGYTDSAASLTGAKLFWASVKDGMLLNVALNHLNKWDDRRIAKGIREANNDG